MNRISKVSILRLESVMRHNCAQFARARSHSASVQIGRLTFPLSLYGTKEIVDVYTHASVRLWQRFSLVQVLGNIYCICTCSSGIVNMCFACLDGKRWFASILQIK